MKKRLKIFLICVVCINLLICIAACSKNNDKNDTTTRGIQMTTNPITAPNTQDMSGANTTAAAVTVSTVAPASTSEAPIDPNAHPLDGKKVLVIGNSYVFFGKTVLSDSVSIRTQKAREHDKGYFYQLCKEMGAEVNVTDWTFSGHALRDLFGDKCGESGCAGIRHEDYLKDRNFDYVVISISGKATSEVYLEQDLDYIMNFFKEANPNVKFVCYGNLGCRGINSEHIVRPSIYRYYKVLEEKGVIIADWGGIVKGLVDGYFTVEGSELTYNTRSFVVKDKYHPNVLSGYLGALTTYCAITKESAVGKPYAFCNDKSINAAFDFDSHLADRYSSTYGTNFPEIFASETEMLGLQKLVDWYLEEKPYIAEANGTFNYANKGMFDQKSVIFIGNESLTSGCVTLTSSKSNHSQIDRMGDLGYFYQICKSLGQEVAVTSWCYSEHRLSDLFAESCPTGGRCDGVKHTSTLLAPLYDYVIVSPSADELSAESILEDFDKIIAFFKATNPNVKVICLGDAACRGYNKGETVYEDIYNSYEKLEEKGVTVIDWGALVDGIITGTYSTIGGNETLDKNSFFTSNGYDITHLSGYMVSLLTYCKITGESAIGAPFMFCGDTSVSTKFNFGRYSNNYDTNFPKVLTSEIEMRAIQRLINDYLGIEYEDDLANRGLLDGKKILIIGNSYVYSGRMVIPKSREYLTQESRTGDLGYFYQLCKSQNSMVSVTNWVFASHGLFNIFDGTCTVSGDCKGEDHESYLTDRYFDYVIVSANASATAEKNFLSDFDYIIDFFKEANPDVQIICLGNLGCRGYTSTGGERPNIYNNYKTLSEKGVIIADWGGLVAEIIEGKREVPGATLDYQDTTFLIKNGYDSTNLSGYIASVFAYCAITGESAVGLAYDFCDDTSISTRFDFGEYTDVAGYETNFPDVFASEADMLGLQTLIDSYLAEKAYLK